MIIEYNRKGDVEERDDTYIDRYRYTCMDLARLSEMSFQTFSWAFHAARSANPPVLPNRKDPCTPVLRAQDDLAFLLETLPRDRSSSLYAPLRSRLHRPVISYRVVASRKWDVFLSHPITWEIRRKNKDPPSEEVCCQLIYMLSIWTVNILKIITHCCENWCLVSDAPCIQRDEAANIY